MYKILRKIIIILILFGLFSINVFYSEARNPDVDEQRKTTTKKVGYEFKNDVLTYTYTTKDGKTKTVEYIYKADITTGTNGVPGYELTCVGKERKEATDNGAQATIKKDDLDGLLEGSNIYVQPKNKLKDQGSDNIDDLIKEGDEFISTGNIENVIPDQSEVQDFSQTVYNMLLTVGIVVAVLAGVIIGIKLMLSSAEEKAEAKNYLVPYVAGCIIVFGGFAIWKLVVTILQGI